MEQSTQPKRKQTVPTVLYIVFLMAELVGGGMIDEGDLFSAVSKTAIFSALIFTAYQKKVWAIWVAGVLLILQSLSCFSAGLDEGLIAFHVLGLFYVLYGMYIINSRPRIIPPSPALSNETDAETSATIVSEAPLPQRPVHSQGFVVQEQEYIYPFLIKQYQAIFIDMLVLFAILITIMILTDEHEHGTTIMITSGLFVLLTYEPLLTVYGATMGQRLVGIRVRKMQNPAERISLFNAYLRIVTKLSLGTVSFLTINTNPEHRAIHDFVSGSVMVREKKI